jgi:hypothetical protein
MRVGLVADREHYSPFSNKKGAATSDAQEHNTFLGCRRFQEKPKKMQVNNLAAARIRENHEWWGWRESNSRHLV